MSGKWSVTQWKVKSGHKRGRIIYKETTTDDQPGIIESTYRTGYRGNNAKAVNFLKVIAKELNKKGLHPNDENEVALLIEDLLKLYGF